MLGKIDSIRMATHSSAAKLHEQRFGVDCRAFQAPGRVNLIGEHTDTSEGFVMPVALNLRTISTISPLRDLVANIYSENFNEQVMLDLHAMDVSPHTQWSQYPVAVLRALRERGIEFVGFDMTLSGNVPLGSGLSSSASVEVAVALAVLAQAGVTLDKTEIAKLCQRAENEFIGTQSGIMDPLASCCGVEGHALLLDCRSLEYEPLPLPKDVALVICNTMIQHSLYGGGGYNRRRAEVDEGVRILQQHRPAIDTLRDVTEQELRSHQTQMPDPVFRRCLHVVTENRRVLQAAEALRECNLLRFGALMHESHVSMSDNYEAGCAEADALVDIAMRQPGCYGARITGAGFGGCTVNPVAVGEADAFVKSVRAAYKATTEIDAEIYLTHASNGAGPLVTAQRQ